VFAGTAELDPITGPVLYVDLEGGTLSLRAVGISPNIVRVQNFEEQFNTIYEYLTETKHPFKTVVMDSLSEIQAISMAEILRQSAATNPSKDADVPVISDWLKSSNRMRRLIRHFKMLPTNLILICHEKRDRNEVTGEIKILPSLPGQLAVDIAGFCDVVGRIVVESVLDEEKNTRKKIRACYVQPVGNFVAKDRNNAFGDRFMVATYNAETKTWEDGATFPDLIKHLHSVI
jgi:hypothetical protein